MFEYRAHVTRVLDGDTFDCTVDCGFHIKFDIRVRMSNINAPETRTKDLEEKKRGLTSKAYLTALIEGKDIILNTRKEDTFNSRWLGEVFIDDGEHSMNVNQLLVDEGYAIPYMVEE